MAETWIVFRMFSEASRTSALTLRLSSRALMKKVLTATVTGTCLDIVLFDGTGCCKEQGGVCGREGLEEFHNFLELMD